MQSNYFVESNHIAERSSQQPEMMENSDNVPLAILEQRQQQQQPQQQQYNIQHSPQSAFNYGNQPQYTSNTVVRHGHEMVDVITEPPMITESRRMSFVRVRAWKIFPGRNRFFCNGKIIMGKQISVFYFTISLLVSTCVMFFVNDCPYLTIQISLAVPIVAVFLFLFVLFCFFRTSFTDPGIIPRATPDEAADVERQIVPNQSTSPTYRPPPRTKEVVINNQSIKLKYCFTCKIFRPPRASHCSLCDNCVERFDHHCPWVGNCVGKRNYRFFYMFIVSLAMLCVYVFALVITHLFLLSKDLTFVDAVKKSPVSVIECVICFFSVWSILGLAGFHTYLVVNNLTTNEDIKGSFSSRHNSSIRNPYSLGSAWRNCYSVLCSPWTPSLINADQFLYIDPTVLPQYKKQPPPPPPSVLKPQVKNSLGGYPIQHQHSAPVQPVSSSINYNVHLSASNRNPSDTQSALYVPTSYDEASFGQYHHHHQPPPSVDAKYSRNLPTQMPPCTMDHCSEGKFAKHLGGGSEEHFVGSSYNFNPSPQPCRLHQPMRASDSSAASQVYYGSLKKPRSATMPQEVNVAACDYPYMGPTTVALKPLSCSQHPESIATYPPPQQLSQHGHQHSLPPQQSPGQLGQQQSQRGQKAAKSGATKSQQQQQQQRRASLTKIENHTVYER